MLKNFLIIAIRNIKNNKTFTFINIAGLSIGMASAIFILLFIISELSYDRVFTNSDKVFRVFLEGHMSGSHLKGAWSATPAGPVFTEEIPEIISYTRIRPAGQVLVKSDDKKFLEENLVYADSTFLEIFDLPVIFGDPSTILKDPNSMVLTESIAEKYFGHQNPVGRKIFTDADSVMFQITGVIGDLPDETHLDFDLIASYSTKAESRNNMWLNNLLYTYFLLDNKGSKDLVEEKMQAILIEHISPQLMQMLGINMDDFASSGNEYGLYLQELTKIHFQPEIQGGFKAPSDKKYIMIFGFIAILILFIASINFMNLSTTKASHRAKEVGMRKVVGAERRLLIKQFLLESVFLSFISLAFALVMVEVLLPYFNNMMGLNLKMNYLTNWYTIPLLLVLAFMVGIISGSYPAFILASYDTVEMLKGKFSTGSKGSLLRNVLVIAQFSISMIIIIGTIVIFAQHRFFINSDLGFEKDSIIVLYRNEPVKSSMNSFLRDLEQNPCIESVSNSTVYAGRTNNNQSYQIKGRDRGNNYLFHTNWTDYHFPETHKIEMVSGRFFDPKVLTDSIAVVINESSIEKYGIENPLATVFVDATADGAGRELHVIGVVKDFHSAPLREEIAPYMFQLKPENFPGAGFISVRHSQGNHSAMKAMDHIRSIWGSYADEEPLQYFFLSDRLKEIYREEERSGNLALVFSFLAIFVAVLGLSGLNMYNTQRRTREIGIRKVHGATSLEVVILIVRETSMLIVISAIIAWAVSYKIINYWLQDFTYHIELSPWMFFAGAGIAFVIALTTVSIQAYHAAQVNPASSLHYE